MLAKPPECHLCVLEKKGLGFCPPDGPLTAPVLIIGEGPGRTEAVTANPFSGPAGGMLKRALALGGMDQRWLRVTNLISCQPPGDWLSKSPWEEDAISTCSQYLNPILAENHPVVVTAGSLPTRRILELPSQKFRIQDFHGTVQRDPSDRFWVVPTFHPSYLQRGATNLLDVLKHDLQRAFEVAKDGWTPSPMELVCDPDLEFFEAWAKLYLDAVGRGEDIHLAVDIETPDSGKVDEGERGGDISWTIIRINFACNGEQGITVLFAEPYLTLIKKILASPGVKVFWNGKDFDIPRLRAAEMTLNGELYDAMWAWHVLQSALPRGLGFVAPFYSDGGAWKHLSETDPVHYAAKDGVETWRGWVGIVTDLIAQGMWEVFERDVHEFHREVLDPAEDVGLGIDREATVEFGEKLRVMAEGMEGEILQIVPMELAPLEKPEGWKKLSKRLLDERCVGVWGEKVMALIQVCETCGAEEIAKTHKCRPKTTLRSPAGLKLTPRVVLAERKVIRYFRRTPFNPRSPVQVLAYIHSQGHKPGKDKKTQKATTNKETLDKLYRKHRDPFYKLIKTHRQVSKVKGTYVDGTLKRLDKNDRLHSTFTPKPTTMRMASEDPNLQNVIDDKEESPAAGFRACIVPAQGMAFVEADIAGVEPVLVGYRAGDPDYIRMAHLGMHAWVLSHVIQKPLPDDASDDDLAAYFQELKSNKKYKHEYHQCKRNVNGTNYGLTPEGMALQLPDVFPTVAGARKIQRLYFELAPSIPKWQTKIQMLAKDQLYLGGPGAHPFGYKHRFFDVVTYKPLTDAQAKKREKRGEPVVYLSGRPFGVYRGGDAKKALAFEPQSIAAGVMRRSGGCLGHATRDGRG